jgi:RNA polymerase sigma-70 factor (ECF subfamily)
MAMPEIQIRDDDLVPAAMAGDRAAFARLVRRERDRLVMAARGIVGNFHEAEDCAQDALVSAWRALPSLKDPAKFRPWLMKILTREALARRRKPGPRLLKTDPAGIAGRTPPEHDRLTRLVAEMERLPGKYRLLLSLHYLAGLTYVEVGAAVGLAPGRVKSRLHDARRMLERRLADG